MHWDPLFRTSKDVELIQACYYCFNINISSSIQFTTRTGLRIPKTTSGRRSEFQGFFMLHLQFCHVLWKNLVSHLLLPTVKPYFRGIK